MNASAGLGRVQRWQAAPSAGRMDFFLSRQKYYLSTIQILSPMYFDFNGLALKLRKLFQFEQTISLDNEETLSILKG